MIGTTLSAEAFCQPGDGSGGQNSFGGCTGDCINPIAEADQVITFNHHTLKDCVDPGG